MKNLITLLLILPLFAACSSDDDNNSPTQDYTSFTIIQNAIDIQPNTIVGYKLANGTYKKIAELGDLKKGIPSKEVKLTDKSITDVYVFTDYISTRRLDKVFKLTPNTNNSLVIPNDVSGTVVIDKNNPDEYPQ